MIHPPSDLPSRGCQQLPVAPALLDLYGILQVIEPITLPLWVQPFLYAPCGHNCGVAHDYS